MNVPVRVCRVQPDVPAVHRSFDYLVPDDLAGAVRVGTVVRVPLHGRSVRGWVVADAVDAEARPDQLRPLRKVVSAGPPAAVVDLCIWTAHRYAGPVTALLRAASPPTAVAPEPWPEPDHAVYPESEPPVVLAGVPVRVVEWPPAAGSVPLVKGLLAPAGSTIVVVPEPGAATQLVEALAATGRVVLEWHAELADAARSGAWDDARRGACVIVGGRTAVFAPVPDLAALVVLDEADEALQEERAPTWHAREVGIERARRAGVPVTLVGPALSVHARHGRRVVEPDASVRRAGWPVLDVVDLRGEPPGTGGLAEAIGPALDRATRGGGRAVLVVNRRGRARLLACRNCRELARCEACGAAVVQPDAVFVCRRDGQSRPPVCLHCGATKFRAVRPGVVGLRDQVAALAPRASVAAVDVTTERGSGVDDAEVVVGTEAALHRADPHDPRSGATRPVRLVAFLEFDQELLAPRYRAEEHAAHLLARAARLVGPRTEGGRLLVQTRVPGHDVLRAIGDAHPGMCAEAETTRRAATGYPPFGGLAQLSGDAAAVEAAVAALRAAGAVTVLGPVGGTALVRGRDASRLADALDDAIGAEVRARGRLRVAVDPPRV